MRCDGLTEMLSYQSHSYVFQKVRVCALFFSAHVSLTDRLASVACAKDDEFLVFRKQLYHASLTQILWPLRDGMTTPHVMQCPDGHFRRTIFGIGPFIADYPEQVVLAGIVQGWCPK